MVLIMKICLISLILENLFLIYRTYLVKEMKFDKLAKNNILGNLFGCGFAITFVSVLGIFAYCNQTNYNLINKRSFE